MNLIEAERLVRRLSDILQHRAPEAQARSLAQDYATVCHDVSHRLEQCAAMLAHGDEAQALQLAEAPPPLLELIARLAFREASEWRTFCLANGHPIADAFEGKFIRQLGEAYGKGIAPDHQLYREYREAVLRHQDSRAVAALRSIVRRNPADPNAPRELERLEKRILGAALTRLAAALEASDASRAVSLVEEFEALDFAQRPSGDVWQRAQQARCLAWLSAAQASRARNDWVATGSRLAAIDVLREEHALAFAAAQENALADLRSWVETSQRTEAEDTKCSRALLALQQLLNFAEEKQLASRAPGRRELRADLETLERKWREIEQFSRPVPDELTTRTRKMLALLRVQVARKDRQVRHLTFAGVAVFAVVAVAAGLAIFRINQAKELAALLREHREGRQVAPAEKLVQQIRATQKGLANKPALRQELEQTDTFLARERQLVAVCETNLAGLQKLASRAFIDASWSDEWVDAQFKAARQAVAAVAEGWQPPERNRLAGLEAQWSKGLAQRGNVRNQSFELLLRKVQPRVENELKYELGPDAVRRTLADLAEQCGALDRFSSNSTLPELRIATSHATEYATLKTTLATFQAQVGKWDEIQRCWQSPTTLEAYLESLKLLQNSDFASQDLKNAARDVGSLDDTNSISISKLQGALLLPDAPGTWDLFVSRGDNSFAPSDVLDAERSRFNRLRDDEHIHSVRNGKRTFGVSTQSKRPVYTLGLLAINSTNRYRAGKIYDPVASPGTLDFKQDQIHPADFEDLGWTPGAAVFDRVGLKDFIDTRTSTNYTSSLLGVLDRINQETQGSSLLRAFLALRVFDLMDLRPNEWGVAWAPQATFDRRRLVALGANTIQSGDWLVPARIDALDKRLQEHFESTRKVSYREQARFLSTLAGRVKEAGFTLAGYAGTNGQPVLSALPLEHTELWGWTAATKTPALLFRYLDKSKRYVKVNDALPLTPLLILRTERQAILEQVRLSFAAKLEEVGSELPPLFQIESPHE